MFELKRHLRQLLREPAVFECIGKLISLANAHQKLRLRKQFLDPHARSHAPSRKRGEVDVGGEVLLARRLVRIGASRVMPIRHERASVAPRKLVVALVTGGDYY